MRSLAVPLAALLFSVGAASAEPVRVLGRSVSDSAGGFSIAWPTSGFEASFSGPKLTATIEDPGKNLFDVEIDGVTTKLALKPGTQTYVLFDGKPGQHLVRMMRRTNGLTGPTYFKNISAQGLSPTKDLARRMLVIGDSISAGYGVEGKDQFCSFTAETENANLSYAALAARALNADLHDIALDGYGAYRNYAGDDATMSALSWRTLPGAPAKWSSAAFQPDVIVVNLGTNDFANGEPGPGFGQAYLALLKSLRAAYPSAWIFGAAGGMLDEAKRKAAASAISSSVETRKAAGDPRNIFIVFNPPETGRRYGCDWHPGRDAQQDMAQTLQRAIIRTGVWTN